MSFHIKTYINLCKVMTVSIWNFYISFRPFYVRGITHNDIEMCCCKEHLHARWSVAALIECFEKNSITLKFNSYDGFFFYLTKDCQTSPATYINWECTPTKKDFCPDIQQNWNDLRLRFSSLSNPIWCKLDGCIYIHLSYCKAKLK